LKSSSTLNIIALVLCIPTQSPHITIKHLNTWWLLGTTNWILQCLKR